MERINTISPKQNTDLLPGLHFLCRLFWGPDPEQCREMMQTGFLSVFGSLKTALSKQAAGNVDAFYLFLKDQLDSEALYRKLQITYTRLFVSDRETLCAPIYQSCYLFEGAPLMGPPALRMRERLASSGLSLSGEGNEPPDHLAVELEYLYFLLAKGLEENDPESTTRAADFAATELSTWLPIFTERLSRTPNAEPYNFAAFLTLEFVRFIAGKEKQ